LQYIIFGIILTHFFPPELSNFMQLMWIVMMS